jgi:NAD+ synthase
MKPIRSASALDINTSTVIEAIDRYLNEVVADLNVNGVCLGLSGGVDSAVLVTLAAHSFGAAQVHPLYLFDRDSSEELRDYAASISDGLGISLVVKSIDENSQKEHQSIGYGFRNRLLAPHLHRILHTLYRLVFKESPFESSLWIENPDPSGIENRNPWFRTLIKPFIESMNKRHIIRRKIIEQKALLENLLLLGAANKTEWLTGWFVKDGIDDIPIQPLKGLYKTQVRQLAYDLDIPREVMEQPPSPDMILGITDEFGLGMPYWKIDLALDHLDGGIPKTELFQQGVTRVDLNRVKKLVELSGWKRDATFPQPPVEGVLRGGFRI